jgi:hypothetical protein
MSNVSEILRFLFSTLAVISFEQCVNFAGALAYQPSHSLVLSVYVQIRYTDYRAYVQFVSYVYIYYTGFSQKNGAVSKVNKKSFSHLTRVQCVCIYIYIYIYIYVYIYIYILNPFHDNWPHWTDRNLYTPTIQTLVE